MDYEEKMTEDNTEKDGQRSMHQERGSDGASRRTGSPGRLFQEAAVLPQALRRSHARQELKLKASWLHILVMCKAMRNKDFFFPLIFNLHFFLLFFMLYVSIMLQCYKVHFGDFTQDQERYKSDVIICNIYSSYLYLQRIFVEGYIQGIGNFIASGTANVWDTLEEQRLETSQFGPSQSYTSECIPNSKNK